MTSIGLRPALLFFSLPGVNVAASISARKLSNGTTRSIISSGSPFAEITASRLSASKKPNRPIVPTSPNPIVTVRLAQIQEGRYFSKCPKVKQKPRAPEHVVIPKEYSQDLSSMSIDELWALHQKVAATLVAKIAAAKKMIADRLRLLNQVPSDDANDRTG